MRNAYAEVFRTYPRRAFTSWTAASFVVIGLIQAAMLLALAAWRRQTVLPIFAMACVWLGAPMWIHFREMMVNERAMTLPSYRRPQLIVFVLLAVALVIVWPTALLLLVDSRTFVGIAIDAVLFAIVGWWVLTLSRTLTLIGGAFWLWLLTCTQTTPPTESLAGTTESAAAFLAAAGLVAAALAIWRLSRLTEEDPEYHRRPPISTWSVRPRMTGEVNEAWAQAQNSKSFGWPSMRARTPIMESGAGLWRRSKRWQSLNNSGIAVACAVAAAVLLMIGLLSLGGTDARFFAKPVLLVFLLFMPSMMGGASWLRMWRFMDAELLRPIERASLLRELALAMFTSMLKGWLVFAVAFIVAAMVYERPINFAYVATALASSLLLQIFAFGGTSWLMRYHSPALTLLAVAPAGPVAILLAQASDPAYIHDRPLILALSVGAAAVGWVIARNAYRRWLVTELG